LCGFDPRVGGWQVLADAMIQVQRDLGWTRDDAKASGARSAPVWTCTFGELDDAWIVESVATMPEFRRRGLVDALMGKVLEQGQQLRRRVTQLTIMIGNEPARRAYEKVGFRVHDEKRHRDFERALGAPGFMRMVRDY
jgi:ribosomal protein S18 acetylase RimI-like enzyme